jgi:hypothetical protein
MARTAEPNKVKTGIACLTAKDYPPAMSLGYLALMILALLAVVGVFLMRRSTSSDEPDLGSVSTSWLAEHKSGHQ